VPREVDERTVALEGGCAVLGEELLRHDREVNFKRLMSARALLDYRLLLDLGQNWVDTCIRLKLRRNRRHEDVMQLGLAQSGLWRVLHVDASCGRALPLCRRHKHRLVYRVPVAVLPVVQVAGIRQR
jgi:hypothetical protein